VKLENMIPSKLKMGMQVRFNQRGWLPEDDLEAWEKWPLKTFIARLLTVYPRKTAVSTGTAEELISDIPSSMDHTNMDYIDKYFSKVWEQYEKFTPGKEKSLQKEADKRLVEVVLSKMKKGGASELVDKLKAKSIPSTIFKLWCKWEKKRNQIVEHIDFQRSNRFAVGFVDAALQKNKTSTPRKEGDGRNKGGDKKRPHDDEPTGQKSVAGGNSNASGPCKGCGKSNHPTNGCRYLKFKHPDANYTDAEWADSAAGAAWREAGFDTLQGFRRLDGTPYQKVAAADGGVPNRKERRAANKHRGNGKSELSDLCSDCLVVAAHTNNSVSESATLPCEIVVNDAKLLVHALIDTGALQSNYMSIKTGAWIKIQQEADQVERNIAEAVTHHTCCLGGRNSVLNTVPCIACNNKPYENNEDFLLDVTNSNSRDSNGKKRKRSTHSHDQVRISESTIPKSTPLNAHLQTPNIKQLTTKVCSGINGLCTQSAGEVMFDFKFKNELTDSYEILQNLQAKLIDTSFDLLIGRPDIIKHSMLGKLCNHFGGNSDGEVQTHSGNATLDCPSMPGQPSVPQDHPALNLLIRKDDLLTPEEDDDGIELKVKDYLWELEDYSIPEGSSFVKPLIEGSEKLRAQLEGLVAKYNDIFSEQPRPTPAGLEPMEFEVDYTAWRKPKNRLPQRTQTRAKEYEIEKQINKMIANNIIKPSQAAYYSQVHLTPKPNGKWRFCLDYRPLNGCSDLKGWPIPNVKCMLQRLGNKRAKFYAVMDLTSGYHQAPLSKKSQEASAFIIFMGVYEWLRVPMGLKGAPSYFQQQMATKVLANLIYHICELYLDDIIVYGDTEEEFLNNLSQVFERLRKFGITVNPAKCRFGLSEIEYVGHVINENGLTFSTEKREEVLNFPLPTTHKGMKQFLGLANYFRDNVQNHSMLVKPLQDMVEGYSKNRPLKWTPELIDVFNEVRIKVGECPALSFMREDLPVFLHTDASDYGIGAYLFQKSPTEDVELPVAFISKSLTKERLRWSVPEKEAYAIFYAFQKLEYLIRDVYFILCTDHKNLTYINEEGSPKVRRWKLAIQEYNFDIEYIKGEDNVVADALSRLCAHTSDTEEQLCVFDDHALSIPNKKYKLIAKVHNSTAGHNGVEKTLQKLEARGEGTWPHMREHVKQFIKDCPVCQKLDQRNVKIKRSTVYERYAGTDGYSKYRLHWSRST
jgi:hypothetical protein